MEEFETEKEDFIKCVKDREFNKQEIKRLDEEISRLSYDCRKLHTIKSNLTSRKEKIENKIGELKEARKRAIFYVVLSAVIALISAILITSALGPITLYNLIVPLILSEIVLLPIGITVGYPKYSEIKSFLEQNSIQFVENELKRIDKETKKSDSNLIDKKNEKKAIEKDQANIEQKIQNIFNSIFKEFDIINIPVKDITKEEEDEKVKEK